jgi:N-methylhydantoinase A
VAQHAAAGTNGAYRIGVDIGGTFTDCVVVDGAGRVATITKSPTTPEDHSLGVMGALQLAATALRLSLRDLLTGTEALIHGCTVATNALIERKGARTGLITTQGFEDTIFIGRVMQKRAGLLAEEVAHQSRLFKAEPPVVWPALIRGVAERVDALGEILCPLDEEEVGRALQALVEGEGATALAICFLWSFARPDHERRVQKLAARQHPSVYVAASHDVAPVLGEYERTVSVVLTAYLGPTVSRYVRELDRRLTTGGLPQGLLMMTCRGGLTSAADASQHPLLTLDSGPVGGAIGGKLFAQSYKEEKLICADMGGTSFDVSLVIGGDLLLETVPTVDKYTFFCPKVAVRSIGAGGGSIVAVDVTGVPKVGPESAGSRPGPACYGVGGAEPTVTDVDLVLGYLNPDNFLGGRIKLDRSKAEAALGRVGKPLGMDARELAVGAFAIVNSRMADMVSKLTIESGHDPRDFALLAFGGASGIHLPFLAQDLNVRKLYIPQAASAFSAMGMVHGDVIHTVEHSFLAIMPLSQQDRAALNALLQELEERVLGQFAAEGWAPDQVKLQRLLSTKYRLQVHELAVPVTGQALTEEEALSLPGAFERLYEKIYGSGTGYSQVGIEMVKVRVDGVATPATPPLGQTNTVPEPDPASAFKGVRDAYLPSLGRFVPTKVYDGDRLQYGNLLEGPCIIERMGDTVVVPAGARGSVDTFGTLCLEIQEVRHGR